MRSTTAAKLVPTPTPVPLADSACPACLCPHLARPTRGLQGPRGSHRVCHLMVGVLCTGMPWPCVPIPPEAQGTPASHAPTVASVCAPWAADGSLWQACVARGAHLAQAQPRARSILHGEGMGSAGDKHPQGEQGSAMPDNHGAVLAPLPGAPVHAPEMGLLAKGLNALKPVAKAGGVDVRGAALHRDGGWAAARHRTGMCHAGRIPTITEQPRHRTATQGGRQRLVHDAIPACRRRVARPLAWEEQCKR